MFVEKILSKDVTTWSERKDIQEYVADRMGWVDSIDFCIANKSKLLELKSLVERKEIESVVLLGMGGSVLAPKVFSSYLGEKCCLDFHVLDTTHADLIADVEKQINLSTTLFIVANKSGGTLETLYLMNYFYEKVVNDLGDESSGQHFLAITDSGSELAQKAKKRNFLDTLINPSDIGGRFSALSFFGLVPATLIGLPLDEVLLKTKSAIDAYSGSTDSIGSQISDWMIDGYDLNLDRIAITSDEKGRALVLWIEQLVAESLGKEGEGIFPYWESPGVSGAVKKVHIEITESQDGASFKAESKEKATLTIGDITTLGETLFHWKMATACAAAELKVNPFDQPNVAEAKINTLAVLNKERDDVKYSNIESLFSNLVKDKEGYLAVLVYAAIDAVNWPLLEALQVKLSTELGLPVAVSFGPRYLHSTGQLHKGGKQNGNFLIVLKPADQDLEIPQTEYSFNQIMKAQAEGDFIALSDRGLHANLIEVAELKELI